MKIPYGSQNDQGQWWDGKTWRNATEPAKTIMQMERHWLDNEFGTHADGCFDCPRCRRSHFIPDNFDLLCDGCVNALRTHPNATQEMLDGIAAWDVKKYAHWKLNQPDPDIIERMALRERLALNEEVS